jgi:hypothetical protein
MNAFRRFRAAILAASLSVLAVGAFATPAHAVYPFGGSYCRDRYYGNTLQYYPTTKFYGRYDRTTPYVGQAFLPAGFGRQECLPHVVTLFDAFGRPVGLYQTNYTTFLR